MARCGECEGCRWGGPCESERIYVGDALVDLHDGKGTLWRRWPPTNELYPDCDCHRPPAVKAARAEAQRRERAERELAAWRLRPYHPVATELPAPAQVRTPPEPPAPRLSGLRKFLRGGDKP